MPVLILLAAVAEPLRSTSAGLPKKSGNGPLIDSAVTRMQVAFEDLAVSPEAMASTSGYPPGRIPAHFYAMFEEVMEGAALRCQAEGGYRTIRPIEIHRSNGILRIDEVEFRTKKIIPAQMKGADSVALFVCTIGPGMENWARECLQAGDYLKGYMVDAIASELVEAAMNHIQDRLEEKVKADGRHITNRFSPGYCGWPVSEQHKLFSLLPRGFCGITPTESALMRPLKSVSGIIGIGGNVRKRDYPCKSCDMRDCIYRRKRQKEVV